jgi:hypothetical protein
MSRWSASAARAALILSLALGLAVPGAAQAHHFKTAAGHQAEDEVIHSPATEKRLNSNTRLLSAAASDATAAAVAADPGQVGQWGQVNNWPVVGIHVALLPNGKVLAWDSVGDAATEKSRTTPSHGPPSMTRPRAHTQTSASIRATTSSARASLT